MAKNRGKNTKPPLIKKAECGQLFFSREEYIQMYSEAYYQAMKKLENERVPISKEDSKLKRSKLEVFFFLISIIFIPKHIKSKQFGIHMADNLLSVVVALVLDTIGFLFRAVSFILFFYWIWLLITTICSETFSINSLLYTLSLFIFILILSLIGGAFSLSSKEIANEQNQNKIYAYSSAFMASIAFFVSVISFVVSAFKVGE